ESMRLCSRPTHATKSLVAGGAVLTFCFAERVLDGVRRSEGACFTRAGDDRAAAHDPDPGEPSGGGHELERPLAGDAGRGARFAAGSTVLAPGHDVADVGPVPLAHRDFFRRVEQQ